MAETDDLPRMEPLMLRALTYEQARDQMRVTGCAIRRSHWCAPVLIAGRGVRVIFDDEGAQSTFKPTASDHAATDWEMVPNPAQGGEHG